MLFVALIATFILRKTVIGRHIYAIGSNGEAARLSGISVHKVRIFAFMFSAAMASIAGILTTAYGYFIIHTGKKSLKLQTQIPN